MKHLPHTILILLCTVVIAAEEPQKPSPNTHTRVAQAYYAQVQKAAEEEGKAGKRDTEAMRSETSPKPKRATGVIVDRQGRPIHGASVVVERETSDEVLGKGTTDATGRFQITLSTQSYKGLCLTVTKDAFNRWALTGIYGGIVGHWVRLDREIDKGFLNKLKAERDEERRLWMLLELVGDRQFSTEIGHLFPHIGKLRDDLLRLIQSKVFETKDGRFSSPADEARSLLAYWHDPADEPVFRGWLKGQKGIEKPTGKRMVGKTIPEVCKQWADHHFGGKKPEDRTFNVFNEPLLDPSGNHALVQFSVEYKHWGYSQLLVLTKQRAEWQLRFVADDEQWHTQPDVDEPDAR